MQCRRNMAGHVHDALPVGHEEADFADEVVVVYSERDEALAIGAKDRVPDMLLLSPYRRTNGLTCACFPQSCRSVLRRGEKKSPVWAEDGAVNGAFVAAYRIAYRLTSMRIPELASSITECREDAPPVRTEGDDGRCIIGALGKNIAVRKPKRDVGS